MRLFPLPFLPFPSCSSEIEPSAILFANRAWAHVKAGAFADALDDCSRALAINPDSAKAFRTRAHALNGQKKFAEVFCFFFIFYEGREGHCPSFPPPPLSL